MRPAAIATACLTGWAAHAQPIPEFAALAFCGRADIIDPDAVETCECMEAGSLTILQQDWQRFDAARRDACLRAEAEVNLKSYQKLLECIERRREPLMRCFAN